MKTIDQDLLIKLEQVCLDICALIDSGEIDDFDLVTMWEYSTLKEFLEEQIGKLLEIEERISADEQ